jgi:hypothetical protein
MASINPMVWGVLYDFHVNHMDHVALKNKYGYSTTYMSQNVRGVYSSEKETYDAFMQWYTQYYRVEDRPDTSVRFESARDAWTQMGLLLGFAEEE